VNAGPALQRKRWLNKRFSSLCRVLVLTLSSLPLQAHATEIRVAAASNFKDALQAISTGFEEVTGHRVTMIPGSSGKHFAQILNGAPYDVFFSADIERPRRLEEEGKALNGSRFTYAVGQLVLWSPTPGLVDNRGQILHEGSFRHLAMANPDLAPYGRAARDVLEKLEAWQRLRGKTVRGENVSQAFQFVHSGNAELGFVARSQLVSARPGGSYWMVPGELYEPIRQQAVIIRDSVTARQFMDYVRGAEAGKIIRSFGYSLPGDNRFHVQ
jgi:molybdate transport system substrate-binding protein